MRLFLLVCATLLLAPTAVSQQTVPADTTALVTVEMVDGSRFVGVVIAQTADQLTLRTPAGAEVTIPRSEIRRTVPYAGRLTEAGLRPDDPNRTRLLFAPTARPLGAGEGYLAVYQVILPFVGVGLTDRISVAGGTVLFPEAFGRVWYAAPRVTVLEQEQLAVALGVLGVATFLDSDTNTAGVGYVVATYGNEQRSLTGGVGIGFADTEVGDGVAIMLGGEYQLSRSVKFVSENYLIPYRETVFVGGPVVDVWRYEEQRRYEPVFSGGLRFFGEHLAADLALFTFPALIRETSFPFIPWVGFAYNFGG